MKGVSEIIAIILILMIVIALAALAYTWFSGMFSSLTGTAGTSVTQSTNAMATQFKIESTKWVSPTYVSVTIRNTGSQAFSGNNTYVAFFIDGTPQPNFNGVNTPTSCTGCTAAPGMTCVPATGGAGCILQPGSVAEYRPAPAVAPTCGTSVVKVTIQNGQSDTKTISC